MPAPTVLMEAENTRHTEAVWFASATDDLCYCLDVAAEQKKGTLHAKGDLVGGKPGMEPSNHSGRSVFGSQSWSSCWLLPYF